MEMGREKTQTDVHIETASEQALPVELNLKQFSSSNPGY